MFTKKIQLIFLAVLSYSFAIACTFTPNDFCRTYVNSPDNPAVIGKITAVDEFGIDLEVIEMFRGTESNSVIRIWSGTDFDCNGILSMAASDIGALNDTVIIILNEIIEIENDWDVIGDYRRRDPYTSTTELYVEDGMVNGFISGDPSPSAPPEYKLFELEYDLFKQKFIIDEDCSVIVNTENLNQQLEITLNNPFTDELRIQTDQVINDGLLKIYSITGQLMHVQNIDNQTDIKINSSNLPSSIYFLEIRNKSERLELIKILKIGS